MLILIHFTDIEQGFMPWLIDQVQVQLQKSQLGRLVLDGIIRDVMNQRIDAYSRTSTSGGGATSGAKVSDSKSADGSNNAAPPQDPSTATTSEVRTSLINLSPCLVKYHIHTCTNKINRKNSEYHVARNIKSPFNSCCIRFFFGFFFCPVY